MRKIIVILCLAVLVLMSCNQNEDPIQLNEDAIQLNNAENTFTNKLMQNKAILSEFSDKAKSNNSKNGNNSNGVIFTEDGEFWALGFWTDDGVAAWIYETGFNDVKIFPQENRLEFYMHTNNVNVEVRDNRSGTPVWYTNFCMDEIAVANFKIQTEYRTVFTDEGDPVYLFSFANNTYTSDTAMLNIKMNDAYDFDINDCTEPTTTKRLKMNLVYTPNSNSGNSAAVFSLKILDH